MDHMIFMTSLQITSWVAAILLFVMGVVTGIRVLLWINSNRRQGEATLSPSLVSHDELQKFADDEPLLV